MFSFYTIYWRSINSSFGNTFEWLAVQLATWNFEIETNDHFYNNKDKKNTVPTTNIFLTTLLTKMLNF